MDEENDNQNERIKMEAKHRGYLGVEFKPFPRTAECNLAKWSINHADVV